MARAAEGAAAEAREAAAEAAQEVDQLSAAGLTGDVRVQQLSARLKARVRNVS